MLTYDDVLTTVTQGGAKVRDVFDPATGELIGQARVQDVADLEAAIDKASAAQVAWAALPDAERIGYLHRAADAIDASAAALAELLSREQGSRSTDRTLDSRSVRARCGLVQPPTPSCRWKC